ncbi:unnamed protein product [Musa acuminata subsp. malaccensis]|uniref:(wild Malaysian banana) hypothetical protein n=1 Tax=Musa acuminata subsp. malaccensis TaxID=214687 RepID=A0A804HMA4_MUSAM|nr:unnamed protein product [Musa acuminata subsp. malaccensis]
MGFGTLHFGFMNCWHNTFFCVVHVLLSNGDCAFLR